MHSGVQGFRNKNKDDRGRLRVRPHFRGRGVWGNLPFADVNAVKRRSEPLSSGRQHLPMRKCFMPREITRASMAFGSHVVQMKQLHSDDQSMGLIEWLIK